MPTSTSRTPTKDRGSDPGAATGLLGGSPASEPQALAKAFEDLLRQAPEASFLHYSGGEILVVNPAAEELFGAPDARLLGRRLADLAAPHDRHSGLLAEEECAAQGHLRYEADFLRADGQTFPAEVIAHRIESAGTTLLRSQVQDIGPRRRAEEENSKTSRHDPLTGLANRVHFRQRLQQAVDRAARRGDDRFALLLIDLDRFKTVNHSLGHPTGDRLLAEVACRLLGCAGPSDLVARISGDEFAILVDRIDGLIDARQMAERVNQSLARSISLGGREVHTSAGIGIAVSNPRYQQADDCLRDADTALYRAKLAGGGQQMVFSPGMHQQAVEELQLENALRRAIRSDELELALQPIVDLCSGRIHSFETLVRWRHPERGLLRPSAFLPLAEETGLIADLDLWVLHRTCEYLERWREQLPAGELPTLAMNVSSRQISRSEWVAEVRECLENHLLSPHLLQLEITENALIEKPEEAVEMLSRLGDLGAGVALDDFGTGYASFAYLHRFVVGTLKVDRTFLRQDGRSSAILEALLLLAHKLGMQVVAEGIEDEEALDHLRHLGCDFGQGYYFARPLSLDQALDLLRHPLPWREHFDALATGR